MKSMICFFCALFMVLVCAPAKAQTPFLLYDDFNSEFLDIENWTTSERRDVGVMILESVRELHGGRLHMMGRAFGNTIPAISPAPPYSGTRAGDVNSIFGLAEVFQSLKVSVKVNDAQATGCPDSNPNYSSARARLVGFFFNAGPITTPPTPPGRVNDVLVQIRIQRASNSTDKSQILEVYADIVRCTDPGCAGSSTDSPLSPVLLGKILLGQWATIQIDWNGTRIFNLKLNKEPTVVYEIPSLWTVNQVSNPQNILGVANRIANCPADERGMGFVDAEFENLFVRQFP